MKRAGTNRGIAVFVAAALTALASPALAHPHEVDERGSFVTDDGTIRLEDVRFTHSGELSGVVVNRGSDPLRDVRLLVRYDWSWRDEQNPGEYSPAHSAYFTIPDEIPALGSRPFRFTPTSPLPIRDDGHFTPSVEVTGYTQLQYEQPANTPRY